MSVRLRRLVMIAEPARQPEVVLVIRTAPRARDNVLDLQKPEHVLLAAATIAASVTGLLSHPVAHLLRDDTAHEASGSRSPRRTASASASACRSQFAS
jgi:hypothetical protein